MTWLSKAREMLAGMIHPGPRFLALTNYLPATRFDYATAIGDGLGSNIIMSPILWMARTFPEAELSICNVANEDESEENIQSHAMLQLLRRPNDDYSGMAMWMGTIASWVLDGNAYWIKIRNERTREVQRLWYVPHWLIKPAWPQDGSEFISHYEYTPTGAAKQILLKEDVMHFRHGLDPRNPRKGMSPIWPVLREVFTDEEAANFTASVLKNMGAPGIVISPADNGQVISDPQAAALKEYLATKFSGDNRGVPLVMKGATKVEQFGWSPKEMSLGDLRNIPEERVCAILGIPAAVVGFGTGLETTKVGATFREMVALAWKQCIIPNQRLFSEQLKLSLLPEFEPTPDAFEVWFDTSDVEALQESENARVERITKLVSASIITLGEARSDLGYNVDDSHDIYLRGFNIMEVPAAQLGQPPLEPIPAANPAQDKPMELPEAIPPKRLKAARSARPTALQRNLIQALDRDRKALEKVFHVKLEAFFNRLGKLAGDAAGEVLKSGNGHAKESLPNAVEMYYDDEDLYDAIGNMDVGEIMKRLPLKKLKNDWFILGQQHFLNVAQQTFKTVSTSLGIEIGLPDHVAERILAAGGKHLGLVDIEKQTRDRIFRELVEGRAAGDGPAAIARRIREMVPAGPWSTPQIRAQVISRTESMSAQRLSSVEACRESGVVHEMMVFDGRLENSDEDCIARDQSIVSFEEAEVMDDHPNGSLSLVPYMTTN